MINQQDQTVNMLSQMLKRLPESELLFLKKIIECLIVKASIPQGEKQEEKITAASLRGKYKDIPVSTHGLMQEKAEETEREELRYKEHFEK